MKALTIIHWLGIAGVSPHEAPAARMWAKRLEWPLLIVVLWIPFQWYLEETGSIQIGLAHVFDWMIWLVFLAETVTLAYLVRHKRCYLLHNWINVVIILGSFPLILKFAPMAGMLRSLRLIMVLVLLTRMSRNVRRLLTLHQLGGTLAASIITMLLAGVVITRIDPSIGDIWDGLWWAWATMSTVGYGDVAPHSGAGRLFASLLILLGVVLLSLLTANMSAFLIGNDAKESAQADNEMEVMLRDITARLARIEQQLAEQQPVEKTPIGDQHLVPAHLTRE